MLLCGGGPLDRTIYEALYAGHRPAMLAVARFLTFSRRADGADRRRRRARIVAVARRAGAASALVLIAITMLGRGLSEAQKYWIARARPDLEPHLVVVKTQSFPSGHATSSMIFYLTLALALTAGTRWHRVGRGGAVLPVAPDRH